MNNLFIDNNLNLEGEFDYSNSKLWLNNMISAGINHHLTFLFIDQYKKEKVLCSYNREMSIFFGDAGTRNVDSETLLSLLSPQEYEQSIQIIRTANSILRSHPLGENRTYYLSFNLPLCLADGTRILVKFKEIILYYTKHSQTPWITYCQLQAAKNELKWDLTLFDEENNKQYKVYIFEDTVDQFCLLDSVDISILKFTCDGLTEMEIAKELGWNLPVLKRYKSEFLTRVKARSITQAIYNIKRQGLI